jgi:osmotically-inducible protein OsmY
MPESKKMKTDTQLQQDVMAELQWEPSVHAEQIGVAVKDGVVTLAGHVSSYAEKWNAQRATQRVTGVKALAVEMDVKLSNLGMHTDAEIASTVQKVLDWNGSLPHNGVTCMVEGGWITLWGAVQWQYQSSSAENSVRELMGVKGVSNQISIKPAVSLDAVRGDIEIALKRRAKADAAQVRVKISDSDVTLSGTVPSLFERNLARDAAWGTPGVRQVVDNIMVA